MTGADLVAIVAGVVMGSVMGILFALLVLTWNWSGGPVARVPRVDRWRWKLVRVDQKALDQGSTVDGVCSVRRVRELGDRSK